MRGLRLRCVVVPGGWNAERDATILLTAFVGGVIGDGVVLAVALGFLREHLDE